MDESESTTIAFLKHVRTYMYASLRISHFDKYELEEKNWQHWQYSGPKAEANRRC